MRKRRIVLALIAGLLLALAGAWCLADPLDRSAWLYRAQEDAFAQAAEAALTGKAGKKPFGVAEVSLWTSQTDGSALAADFSVGGWGMGSQTDLLGNLYHHGRRPSRVPGDGYGPGRDRGRRLDLAGRTGGQYL